MSPKEEWVRKILGKTVNSPIGRVSWTFPTLDRIKSHQSLGHTHWIWVNWVPSPVAPNPPGSSRRARLITTAECVLQAADPQSVQ